MPKENEVEEKNEKLYRVYKMFLRHLIAIYYPVKLEWYEFVAAIILGLLFGIFIARIVKAVI